MDDFYLIAEVVDVYDSDGSVIVKSFSDFSERFNELDSVIIDFFGKPKAIDLEFVEKVDSNMILKFQRFRSAEDSFFLVGKKLYIPEEKLADLPQNVYYIHDLLGSEVFINSEFFGKLVDVLKLPSNDTYAIETKSGSEVLIPAVEEFIEHFNLNEKKLILSEKSKMFFEDEN